MNSRVRTLYKIDAQHQGPAQARRIIADELSTVLSGTELEDVKLMVSELVTNGIVHGGREDAGSGDPRLYASTATSVAPCSTKDRALRRGSGMARAAVGDYDWSSDSRTGGEWCVRHGEPKCGSNAIAHEVVPLGLWPRASLQLG